MLRFWQEEVGLPFEELLPLGDGSRQHRHAMNGSVLKLNESREPVPAAPPSSYRELLIAREGLAAPRSLVDPDGNHVTLVPAGQGGVVGIGIRLAVRDEAAFHRFYRDQLGLAAAGDRAYRWGDTLLTFASEPAVGRVETMRAPGYRYITVQVRDVDAVHRELVARGVEEMRAPVTLGSTARISFVRDPDGNAIEISQRASLTGPLPS
jgi:lactoylglutathione lyase